MLEAKLAGEEIAVPEPAEPAQVIDLMEALKASVAQAKTEPDEKPAKKPARKKAAAGGRKRASSRS